MVEESLPEDGASQLAPEEVVVHLNGRVLRLKYHRGETLLETLRRGNLLTPFVCEQGVCGTCMARLLKGEVALRVQEPRVERAGPRLRLYPGVPGSTAQHGVRDRNSQLNNFFTSRRSSFPISL